MLLRACPYYTMFPLNFPLKWLQGARPGEWVVDPFCGRGTTLFAARLMGLPAAGLDISPVAAAIADGMLSWATPQEVVDLAKRLLREASGPIPQGEFWEWAYDDETLREICKLRTGLQQGIDINNPAARLLRVILLGRLHGPLRKAHPAYLSNQMPRTYAPKPAYAVRFWKSRGLFPPKIDVLDLLNRKVPEIMQGLPPPIPGKVACDDARTFDFTTLGEQFSWVITSPPYFRMRTYIPDQWLRYWFLGGPPTVTYSYEGQIGNARPEVYVSALRQVWINVARACSPGARLVVRFGALPSQNGVDPITLLWDSFQDTPWEIQQIQRAGSPENGKRQAQSFHSALRPAVQEIDLLARLVE